MALLFKEDIKHMRMVQYLWSEVSVGHKVVVIVRSKESIIS